MAANPETNTGARAGSPHAASADPDEEDLYSLLGVPFSATHVEITAAYRRAMKRAHPDRQRPEERAAAERQAQRLNEAYATLANPIKRQAYDRTIRQQVIQDQIMRQYVSGFQTFERGSARSHVRREPTPEERRERIRADRQASLTLLFVAVGLTALILAALLFGSLIGALLQAAR